MEKLQLNEPATHYKPFYGSILYQMPKLIAEGRVPISTSDVMRRRLETLHSSEPIRNSWWNESFCVGDALVTHSNGKSKLVLDAQPFREVNPQSKLVYQSTNQTLNFCDKLYHKLDGMEFANDEAKKYSRNMTKEQAKSNPFLQFLARDQHLLDEYVDLVWATKVKSIKKGLESTPPIGNPDFYDYLTKKHHAIIHALIDQYRADIPERVEEKLSLSKEGILSISLEYCAEKGKSYMHCFGVSGRRDLSLFSHLITTNKERSTVWPLVGVKVISDEEETLDSKISQLLELATSIVKQ